MKKTNSKILYIVGGIIIIILIVISVIAAVILKKSDNNLTTNTSMVNSNGKDTVDYAIDLNNYSFSPSNLTSEPGTNLKIKLTSNTGTHNMRIDKLNFDSGMIAQGESKIVTLQIPSDAKGDYEVYCSVGNHKSMGMIGKLTISISGSMMNNGVTNITDDMSFLENMIPHHQEAIDNSNKIIAVTKNTQLKQFAQGIVTAQTKEVTDMKSWYKSWFNKDYVNNGNYQMMMKDTMGMNIGDQEISYINGMIEHHQAAIDMDNKIKSITKRQELITLADNIILTQTQEIGTLRNFLSTNSSNSIMR